jgi:Beta-galactosidase
MAKLKYFCSAFSKTKAGKSVVGIQVAAGVYGEWHYWGFLKAEADFSSPMTTHFRAWLRQKYITEKKLQMAWQSPEAQFESVVVPRPEERAVLSEGNFRLPGKDQKVMDYYRCQHELVADLILDFSREIKSHWRRPIITGAFYGYFFSCFNRQTAGGHLELQKLLRSPHIDYLAGPQAYLPQAEKPGEAYRSRSLVLSLRLHGKLWLDEMDQQPRRSFPYLGGTKDNRARHEAIVQENVAQLRRNLMFSHAKGMGLWLYDFGLAGLNLGKDNEQSPQHGNTGYWDHPVFHSEIRKFLALSKITLEIPYRSEADVLLVYDTEVDYHNRSLANDKDSISLQLIDYLSLNLFYSGTVFDPIHLKDLDKVSIDDYKVVIFANTSRLDSSDRQVIRDRIGQNQRHLFWFCAAGYLNENGANSEGISSLIGMEIGRMPAAVPSQVLFDSSMKIEQSERAWGNKPPLFYVKDQDARVWGRFSENGAIAFAERTEKSHTNWYFAVPILNPNALRFLLSRAGAHCYGIKPSVIYAGSGFLTLHLKNGGKHRITQKSGRTIDLDLPDKPVTVRIDLRSNSVESY